MQPPHHPKCTQVRRVRRGDGARRFPSDPHAQRDLRRSREPARLHQCPASPVTGNLQLRPRAPEIQSRQEVGFPPVPVPLSSQPLAPCPRFCLRPAPCPAPARLSERQVLTAGLESPTCHLGMKPWKLPALGGAPGSSGREGSAFPVSSRDPTLQPREETWLPDPGGWLPFPAPCAPRPPLFALPGPARLTGVRPRAEGDSPEPGKSDAGPGRPQLTLIWSLSDQSDQY